MFETKIGISLVCPAKPRANVPLSAVPISLLLSYGTQAVPCSAAIRQTGFREVLATSATRCL